MRSEAAERETAGTSADEPQRRSAPARTGMVAVLGIAFCAGSCDLGTLVAGEAAEARQALPPVSAAPTQQPRQAAALVGFLAEQPTGLTRDEVQRLADTILAESRRLDLAPRLVLAVIRVESSFRNFAVSEVGALGLMQVMPSTAVEVADSIGVTWTGPQTLFDPEANVKIGIAYLRRLLDRYDDLAVALAAYNWGPSHVDSRLRRGIPLPQVYPSRVLEWRRAPEIEVASRS